MELHPHQREAVDKLKNGSVLNGGVGSGKTHASLAYYVEKVCGGSLDREQQMKSPKDLIIITTAKKRDDLDWESTAIQFGLFRDPEVSYSHKELIVDSWNNIKKYVDREDAFFIFDEQKLVGAGVWVKTFLKIAKQNQWILLSATPADTWIDYVPLFIAHGFYRNRTDFVDQHVVWSFHGKYRKIRGFYGVRHLERHRDSILVEMPYQKHTTRHLVELPVDHDEELFRMVWRRRWNVYTNEPLIDVAEMHRIGRRVVNSDPDRLAAIRKLMESHPRIIIFYNFDYELELLRTLCQETTTTQPSSNISPEHTPESTAELRQTNRPAPDTPPAMESTDFAERSGKKTNESMRSRLKLLVDSPTDSNGSSRTQEVGRSELVIAEWNGHRHDPVPTSDRWVYLVQYQAGSEGWNCTTTDVIVFYSLSYSHKQFEQAQGRIDRLDTPYDDLWYYVLKSDSKIDQLIWRALVAKKNFHEGRNVRFAA